MNDYPVVFSITRPTRVDRLQLIFRLAILAILSIVGTTLGAVAALLYLLLPLLAAVAISQKGGREYLQTDAPRVVSVLRFVLGVYAYFALLTDKLPTGGPDDPVQFAVTPSGSPTPPTLASALTRFLTSIPAALVLAVFGIAAWVVWLVTALMILVNNRYPVGLFDFQCGVLRCQARLFAYHASLVDISPPFSLDTGTSTPASTLPES